MNPIELYKKLPKKNCGECKQGKCMPFALSVIKGEADLTECPYLTPGAVKEIKASLKKSDWREDLILSLKQEVSKMDFSEIAEGLGANFKEGYLVLNCLGREFKINQEGEVFANGQVTPWIKILLLHYIRLAGKGDLSGKWVSYSELKSGLIKASSFQRECEDPLKELLEDNLEVIDLIFKRLGARKVNTFPTEYAWQLFLLPKIPIVILFWQKDEEFDSKLKILFDSTADRFLDAESIIFLVEGLVKNIEYLKKSLGVT
jgi:hypothetical protein